MLVRTNAFEKKSRDLRTLPMASGSAPALPEAAESGFEVFGEERRVH
jgi:hypothetical protein